MKINANSTMNTDLEIPYGAMRAEAANAPAIKRQNVDVLKGREKTKTF
jgi:hypothetical protein